MKGVLKKLEMDLGIVTRVLEVLMVAETEGEMVNEMEVEVVVEKALVAEMASVIEMEVKMALGVAKTKTIESRT